MAHPSTYDSLSREELVSMIEHLHRQVDLRRDDEIALNHHITIIERKLAYRCTDCPIPQRPLIFDESN